MEHRQKLSPEEIKDIIQWDVKNWKNALPFWEAHFLVKPGMKVLALGERDGGISLYFALQGCQVICTDYHEISENAHQMHRDYGVADKITYAQADMRNIAYPDESFDIVVFKSVIGALESIADQDKAIGEIHRVLKKGGAFLFAENATASRLHRFTRRKFVKWKMSWRYVEDAEFESWKKKFSAAYSRKYGFIAPFGRSENQRRFLGGVDAATGFMIPKSWKYIYFGAFIK
jgi:ubiquinone/menaquinone biosynthesis C-methylase UbiE